MIKTEFYKARQDGTILVKTYSDQDFMIRQVETGVDYSLAIDLGTIIGGQYYPMRYVYVETDIKIKEEKTEEELNENSSR